MSSNGHQESQKHPKEKFGVLLRRMTLAALGLDGLEGVGAESLDALASADRFCDRLDQRSQGLGGGSRVEVLSGLPRFMQIIQGRYLPMADNGVLSRVDLDGPRTPADLGPWRRLLDATLLVLFDEDEDGDFVPWSPQVRRRDVGRAIAELARERQLPWGLKMQDFISELIENFPWCSRCACHYAYLLPPRGCCDCSSPGWSSGV